MNTNEIIEKAKKNIYDESLISFFILLLSIQYLSHYLEKILAIGIFHPVIVPAIYTYINTEIQNGIYIFLMSGVIASVIPYVLWKLLNKKVSNIWLNTSSALLSTLVMNIMGCLSTSAIGYAFSSTTLIPEIGQGFLFSYLVAVIFSIVFIEIYNTLFASKFISKTLESPIHTTKQKFISARDLQSAT